MEQTFHLHLYRVREMAEVNIKAEDRESAVKEAMRRKANGNLVFRTPDYRLLVIDPSYGGGVSIREYNDTRPRGGK